MQSMRLPSHLPENISAGLGTFEKLFPVSPVAEAS
jgi:hypothetical protein